MIDEYFAIQVNGYAGVDFNADDLTGEALHRACQRLLDDGVGGILATMITDDVDRMAARLAHIAAIRRRDPLVGQSGRRRARRGSGRQRPARLGRCASTFGLGRGCFRR